METVTKDNSKIKKIVLMALGWGLIVLGVIFVYATDFKRSWPLGWVLSSGGLIVVCLTDFFAILALSKKEMISPWKVKKAIGLLITCLLAVGLMGVSGYDLVKGPQKVVLKEAYTTKEKNEVSDGRIFKERWKTCIAGKTKDGKSVKIDIEEENISRVRTVLLQGQGKEEVIVSYYKGLRRFYDIDLAQ